MADRIVVMRDGLIRQTGIPAELYERPAHARCRRVHGLPHRARRDACVVERRHARSGRGLRHDAAGRAAQAVRAGDQAVTLMVRPEDLVAAARPAFAAVVRRSAEYRGRAFFGAAATRDGTELFFRSDTSVDRRRGDRITLAARPEQILAFRRGRRR